MKAPTHISFAALIYFGLLTSAGVGLNVVNAFLVALASVLPDVDTGASTIGRALPFLSRRLERRFGHRTLTHSVPFIAVLALTLTPLTVLDGGVYLLILAGYISHPVLDSCTVTGVRLLYPLSNARCVFPMDTYSPMRYRIQTGTRQETILGALFVLACVPAFLVALQGHERFVRVAQGNIESAVRDYNDFSRTSLVWADCRAHNLLSKVLLNGRFFVLGAPDAQTLLVRAGDGKLHTVGKEHRAEFVAEHIVCHKGEPARTLVSTVDMNGRVLGEAPSNAPGEVHFFGTLLLGEEARISHAGVIGGFVSVSGRGKEIKLDFASPQDLADEKFSRLLVESGSLTVRRVITAQDTDKTVAQISPERHLTIIVQPDDEVSLARATGDTVGAGATIAVKERQAAIRREQGETRLAISALEAQRKKRLADLEEKAARLALKTARDSNALSLLQMMHDIGFAPWSADGSATLEEAGKARAAVVLERRAIEEETLARKQKLDGRQKALEARLMRGMYREEIRSPIDGTITNVERRENGREALIIITIHPL